MYKRYLQNFNLDSSSEVYDVVVVGAGIAGLFASLTLDPSLKVLLLTKDNLTNCNSQLAQGGIAMTLDEDYASHVQDTLKAGSFYNDAEIVARMIEMSQPVLDELLAMGAKFDQNEDGSIAMTAEGGHRKRRIIHSKDLTGEAVMNALIEALAGRKNIVVKTQAQAIDVVTEEAEVCGLVYREGLGEVIVALCHQVVIATGGIGGLFRSTTNATVNTGDGIAMAVRAGAVLRDSEFIQYHPTAMKTKDGSYFLISEAVRGEGGYLINNLGERFMTDQHEMMELAPRDVVAKAINEQQLMGRSVFVDVRHFELNAFQTRFPNIYANCLANGIDPVMMPIPITPVEHYYMGGISCNVDGQVCDLTGATLVKGLYATGEAACTGFHGANRLASNSLLECLALSKRVTVHINERIGKNVLGHVSVKYENKNLFDGARLQVLGVLFKERFSEVFTIVKKRGILTAAKAEFEQWLEELSKGQIESFEYVALYNGLMVANEIATGSLSRSASLGAFLLDENSEQGRV